MNNVFFYALSAAYLLTCSGCSSSSENGATGYQVKFDQMGVKVVAPSSYIMLGQKYQADVFLTAFSSSTPFEIELDSSVKVMNNITCKGGVCTFESLPDKEGLYQLDGRLKLSDPTKKEPKYFPFHAEYMVARPQAVIVPEEFVLHRGQENKLSISIPGIAPADMSVLVSNGSVSGENGHYSVKPGNENKCVITVAYRDRNGELIKLDQQEYKVVN